MLNKKSTTKSSVDWEKIADWQHENKELLIMVASPREDSILVSFGGLNGFVRFPGTDMEKGVVFNALRKSKFEQSIDAFLTGFMEATGIKETEEGGEVLKVLEGAMMNFGIDRSKQLAATDNTQKNGKTNKSKNR